VLLGTALLAVVGFGLGIVAGLVFEEPGLLFDYVTGKTEPAPLDATRSANEFAAAERAKASIPDVAAAPIAELEAEPEEASAPQSEFETADSAAPEPEPTPSQVAAAAPSVAAPRTDPVSSAQADIAPVAEAERADEVPPASATRSGYSVQVGALADAASAEKLALKLRQRGFPVYVAPSAEAGSKRWRVRVGPVATRAKADELADKLEREKLPTWVLSEGRG
jgi:DedD protein